jgi:lysylphosphatidylglycerol synthetase-like protein (DUF2156 family)
MANTHYTSTHHLRPIPEIFTDLIAQLTMLVRKEGQLARTEVSEKLSRMLTGMALVLFGAVLLIPALVILLQAAMAGLVQQGMDPATASLIVGGAALVIGIVIALIGWSFVKPSALVPDKTIDQLQRDAAVAKHAASATSRQETDHGYHQRAA